MPRRTHLDRPTKKQRQRSGRKLEAQRDQSLDRKRRKSKKPHGNR